MRWAHQLKPIRCGSPILPRRGEIVKKFLQFFLAFSHVFCYTCPYKAPVCRGKRKRRDAHENKVLGDFVCGDFGFQRLAGAVASAPFPGWLCPNFLRRKASDDDGPAVGPGGNSGNGIRNQHCDGPGRKDRRNGSGLPRWILYAAGLVRRRSSNRVPAQPAGDQIHRHIGSGRNFVVLHNFPEKRLSYPKRAGGVFA